MCLNVQNKYWHFLFYFFNGFRLQQIQKDIIRMAITRQLSKERLRNTQSEKEQKKREKRLYDDILQMQCNLIIPAKNNRNNSKK